MTTTPSEQTVTIDGFDYPIDALSENAKAQLVSLQEELAILQTARIAYANALKQELPTQH